MVFPAVTAAVKLYMDSSISFSEREQQDGGGIKVIAYKPCSEQNIHIHSSQQRVVI